MFFNMFEVKKHSFKFVIKLSIINKSHDEWMPIANQATQEL
jgi:hypothetical protein